MCARSVIQHHVTSPTAAAKLVLDILTTGQFFYTVEQPHRHLFHQITVHKAVPASIAQ
uniref:Uncharacterized protein n=1 Tax=Anguilla anguilla TaxID=7936 RepID=A0A0E9S4N0_ANGAN